MSDLPHAINLTHDGTLIVRIPKGYEVDKVVVEEMGTENRKKFVHMPADISDYCDELYQKAYERGKAEGQSTHETPSNTLGALDCVERQAAINAIEQMQLPIMRSDLLHEQFIFQGLSEALAAIKELPSARTTPSNMVDVSVFVDPQKVKDALKERFKRVPTTAIMAMAAVDEVPPVSIEFQDWQKIILSNLFTRKGKWIDYSDEGYVECPFCHSATNCDGNKDELHYCFSCGCRIER